MPPMDADPDDPQAPGLPLYARVRAALRARIRAGEFRPGEALPAEARLAASLHVSPGTLRKAVDALVADGTLSRHQGRGTYVTEETEARAHYRFFRMVDAAGARVLPEPVSEEIARARAGREAGARLGLPAGAAVWQITRLRALEGQPEILERIVLPAARMPGLGAGGALPNALYPHFQARYGITVHSAEDRLTAVAADAALAGSLGVAPGAPLLHAERIGRDLAGEAVEWRRSWFRPGAHAYAVRLP